MENIARIRKDDNFIDFVNELKKMKYKVNFKGFTLITSKINHN